MSVIKLFCYPGNSFNAIYSCSKHKTVSTDKCTDGCVLACAVPGDGEGEHNRRLKTLPAN